MLSRAGLRIVVVRGGAVELYEELKLKFAGDGHTVVIYDRRTAPRVGARERERRHREEDDILTRRGFYVIRPIRSRSPE